MTDVFISYSHEDQAFVRQMVAALEAEGFSVWWDHTIPPGQSWESHIARHIETAKACIVVWSPVSVASDWVKEEATTAHEAGKFLPVRTQDAVQPPMGFRRIQAASFEGWRGDRDHNAWVLLLGEVRRLVDAEIQTTRRAAVPPPRPVATRKKLPLVLFGGIGVAIAAAALVAYFVLQQPVGETNAPEELTPALTTERPSSPQTDTASVAPNASSDEPERRGAERNEAVRDVEAERPAQQQDQRQAWRTIEGDWTRIVGEDGNCLTHFRFSFQNNEVRWGSARDWASLRTGAGGPFTAVTERRIHVVGYSLTLNGEDQLEFSWANSQIPFCVLARRH